MKAWILKAALPALIVVGGVTAWAVSRPGSATTVPTAWIDAPVAGAVFTSGPVSVQAHGSAPGGVDRLELAVDGKTVASAAPQGDDRLAVVTIPWAGTPGWHSLTVRAEAGGTWGAPSIPVPVTIGTPGDATPTGKPTGSTTTSPDASTTSTSSMPDETTTTESTVPGETTTTGPGGSTPATRPPGTRPPATVRPTTPLPPLTPPAVSASSDWAHQGDPVRLTAISMMDGSYSLSIQVRAPGGSFRTVATCPGSPGSPCRTEYAFPTLGTYQYRATVTQGGRTASSPASSILIRGNEA